MMTRKKPSPKHHQNPTSPSALCGAWPRSKTRTNTTTSRRRWNHRQPITTPLPLILMLIGAMTTRCRTRASRTPRSRGARASAPATRPAASRAPRASTAPPGARVISWRCRAPPTSSGPTRRGPTATAGPFRPVSSSPPPDSPRTRPRVGEQPRPF